jgi:hypothetical protein
VAVGGPHGAGWGVSVEGKGERRDNSRRTFNRFIIKSVFIKPLKVSFRCKLVEHSLCRALLSCGVRGGDGSRLGWDVSNMLSQRGIQTKPCWRSPLAAYS